MSAWEKRELRFGVIGLGMMGKEFASAAARWLHLDQDIPAPRIVGVCSATPESCAWFERSAGTVEFKTTDYRELIGRGDIDAVYVATPHSLHERMCVDALRAGKHLICEKPFGIDRTACEAICLEAARHPEKVVRCASQMGFLPGAKLILDWFGQGRFGRILKIRAGFLHESDLNPDKPINWKRRVETNGEYGVMGDLGPHVLFPLLRAGVRFESVFARLYNVVPSRRDASGNRVPCDTWDNALLLAEATHPDSREPFPVELEFARIAPGSPNAWYVEVYGVEGSIRYSTEDFNAVFTAVNDRGEQRWTRWEVGYRPVYRTITGPLASFGFGDAILQMWAAYCDECGGGAAPQRLMTPGEALACHGILTAALGAHRAGAAISP